MIRRMGVAGVLLAVAIGCGDDGETGGGPPPEPVEVAIGDFSYQVAPGEDRRECGTFDLVADMYINTIVPTIELGAHHLAVLYDVPPPRTECGQPTDLPVLYAASYGTDPLELPTGTALKLAAGSRLFFAIHLFNPTDAVITARAAADALTLPKEAVTTEAEQFVVSQNDMIVPPQTLGYKVQATCTYTGTTNVFSIWPHMHERGAGYKVTAMLRSNGQNSDVVIGEADSFDGAHQPMLNLDPPLVLHEGDQVQMECTYDNPYDTELRAGGTSFTEMCMAFVYQYPSLHMQDAGWFFSTNCVMSEIQ